MSESKVYLEISEFNRPIVWIAEYYYQCLPGTAVDHISNRCLFASRDEAVRWAKFSMRDEIDWSSWTAPQGKYPHETQRDDTTLTPTFIATVERKLDEGQISKRVTVTKAEVAERFDWWAKTADGNWNKAA